MNRQGLDIADTDRHPALSARLDVWALRCRLTEEAEMEALRAHLRATQATQRPFLRRLRASRRPTLKRSSSHTPKRGVMGESLRIEIRAVLGARGRLSMSELLASSRRHAASGSLTLTGIVAAVGGWFVGLSLFG